jgi:hypothetical protein
MTDRKVIGTTQGVKLTVRPTPEQRAEMAAFIDDKQPGLLDDLGISRADNDRCQKPSTKLSAPAKGETMGDIARAYLQCGAPSEVGPSYALCNNHITVPLLLRSGNDVDFDAEGWSVMFDGDRAIVRCPSHAG